MNRIIVCILLSLYFSASYGLEENNEVFKKIFSDWTNAFNNKNIDQSCSLFSKQVSADYRGYPKKNYSTICDGFKKIFQEKNRKYHYSFDIHKIFHSENLAAIRITWYLSVYENNKLISKVQDEGLDILQKEKNQWKIINYLGYPI